jgi:trans-aconitate methyltransferase
MGIMYYAASSHPDVMAFIKRHYKGGTVLDYGCGTGRYTECFPKDMYLGVDGYEDNLVDAKRNLPGYKFELHDLETWKPKKKFDYLFSSVVLEQIENLPKKWAKHFIFVEPAGPTYRDYAALYKPTINEPFNATTEGVRMMYGDM